MLTTAVLLVCGGEGVTAGELASREGIILAQRRDVVVVGWTGTLDDSDFSFKDLIACCGAFDIEIVACASAMLVAFSVHKVKDYGCNQHLLSSLINLSYFRGIEHHLVCKIDKIMTRSLQ